MGSMRAKYVELVQLNVDLEQQIADITKKAETSQSQIEKNHQIYEEQMKSLTQQNATKDAEILKLSETVRKQIEERIELQSTLEKLKKTGDNEVILLPITSRLKAASLPVKKYLIQSRTLTEIDSTF